jgi:predicted O-methyltransferase YrrM
MYPRWQLAAKYLKYYLTSSSGKGHGIHSPFVFDLITKVLNDKRHYPEYEKVEGLRQQLLTDKTVLNIEDFGAGSSFAKTNLPTGQAGQRTIASIARSAAKSKKFAQLFFRMAKMYQPKTILEMGTSLGITTSYFSLAKSDSNIITMEGAKEVAAIANNNFKSLGLQNISIIEGNFDHTLSSVIEALSQVEGSTIDFAFIDGNHRREPTERYFLQLLPKTNNDSILVFDDIHWSREMEQAWETIKKHPSVRCTIDIFFIGIIFFRQEFREKQHFSIRF